MADFKITPRKDGPLRVEGEDLTLVDEAGNRYDLAGRTAVSLTPARSASAPVVGARPSSA